MTAHAAAYPQIDAATAATAKRVLIINVTRIGDTLLATPAIRAIAAHFRNAEVTVLGHPDRAPVLEHLPYLAKVGGITKKTAWLRGLRDGFTNKPEYDVAFVWGHDETLVRYALRKARTVIAERQKHESTNAKLFCAFDPPIANSVHAVAGFLAMPRAVGVPVKGYGLDYLATLAEIELAKETLRTRLGAARNVPMVGFQVASFATKAYRDWPIQRFIDLGLRLIQRYPDVRFLCFGAASDKARIALLESAFRGRVLSFAGDTSLRESAALMTQLDLYVGIDTGPTHLFSALRKPMVVMYHPSIPSALYKAINHEAFTAIDHPSAASNFRQKVNMDAISVDRVYEACVRALENDPPISTGMPSPGIDEGVTGWPGDALPMQP
jgi:heptosyltransferase III